mgnify:CR=1 FL=1
MTPSPTDKPGTPPRAPVTPATPVYESGQLFGAGKEILIRHAGEVYRLRVTRLNKLILTK